MKKIILFILSLICSQTVSMHIAHISKNLTPLKRAALAIRCISSFNDKLPKDIMLEKRTYIKSDGTEITETHWKERDELAKSIVEYVKTYGLEEEFKRDFEFHWRDLLDHNTLKILLDAGAPVNKLNERGETPLMLTVVGYNDFPYVRSVKALLDAGADTNIKNHEGRVALHYAARGIASLSYDMRNCLPEGCKESHSARELNDRIKGYCKIVDMLLDEMKIHKSADYWSEILKL
ncbi:hypothetical protein A3F66_06650 [candidate division TM6 bacterium RIFCSPHIGHO2_12_FULL_32_22]|nr:MAG: hypothetical protein A3F66_06650 [candidate division TM6 bacterium RIFCSPHIGHO2_12_FULL_32_22]